MATGTVWLVVFVGLPSFRWGGGGGGVWEEQARVTTRPFYTLILSSLDAKRGCCSEGVVTFAHLGWIIDRSSTDNLQIYHLQIDHLQII